MLYLFENIETNVIVFEDMDRFNANRIFIRLREVNTLVNIQRNKEKGEEYVPLKFFYLLRDDIFVSKDRTKFFDYIIPIIPVVDSSNSYNQFIKQLEEASLFNIFDPSFLQSLSLYIDDMRILKNIYNEFVVYFNRLNTTDLDCNKMMSIITYKNLFPRDFSDLQLAKGFIYQLFKEKERLKENEIESLQGKMDEYKKSIQQANDEKLISIEELDDAYAGKRVRLQKKTTDYYRQQELLDQYNSEYLQRKQTLTDANEANLKKLELDIINISREITSIKTKPLKDIITPENIDNIFFITHKDAGGAINDFKMIKINEYFDLLKFLIRHGYLDETYPDYMTYFYDNNLSVNDRTFLRRITDKRGANYRYPLKEPKKIVESPILRNVEFEQEETLNFNLLNCLLENNSNPQYASYLDTLTRIIHKNIINTHQNP